MRCTIMLIVSLISATTPFADPIPNEMIMVPAGVFIMGDGVADCGVDEREVTLTRDFYLGQHEVTNQEYMEALQGAYDLHNVTATTTYVRDNMDGSIEELLDLDNDYCEIQFDGVGTFYLRESPSSNAQGAYPGGYDPSDHPVKEVTWYGAARYCDWLSQQGGLPRAYAHGGDWSCNGGDPYGAQGYRLATDAEWEYAAQFDDERIYPWGQGVPDCGWVNYRPSPDYCVGWTSPVGSYPDAPQALGVSDMAGDVSEWCNDWHVCDLGTNPATDPTGLTSGTHRAFRGGSWRHSDSGLRCGFRNGTYPNVSGDALGFRIARTVPTTSGIEETHDRSLLNLEINQPNPFIGLTQISYAVPDTDIVFGVLLGIYSPTGRQVCTLVNAPQSAGPYTVSWDGTNSAGQPVEVGAYFYRLNVGEMTATKRMLLIR